VGIAGRRKEEGQLCDVGTRSPEAPFYNLLCPSLQTFAVGTSPCFPNGETEAQRGKVAYPGSLTTCALGSVCP
jgi:hypothetical protein